MTGPEAAVEITKMIIQALAVVLVLWLFIGMMGGGDPSDS